MPRYKLWIDTGFVGDDQMDNIIETDEPLTEDELMDLAQEHFNDTVSYGAYRMNANDEPIDIDAEENDEESEEE